MKSSMSLFSLVLFALIISGCTGEQTASTIANKAATLTPSEALQTYRSAYAEQAASIADPEAKKALKQQLASEVLQRVPDSVLAPEQQLDHAELLRIAGEDSRSQAAYEELAQGDDVTARKAHVELMNMALVAEEIEKVEDLVATHRTRFVPSTEHLGGMYRPLKALAEHYAETGQKERAVNLVLTEIKRLPTDAPYAGYNLLMYADGFFRDAGRLDEYSKLVSESLSRFRSELAALEQSVNREIKGRYADLVRRLGNAEKRLEMTGKAAPALAITQFISGEPTSLEALRSRVVIVEFWANWCPQCKTSFPKLRALYDKHRDDGLEILGVTSLQGYFIDGDISERDITPEREIELTKAMLPRHSIVWPVAFIDGPVYNLAWGVNGVPTVAVLDKRGIVRLVRHGSGDDAEVEIARVVRTLLAK